MNRFKLVTRAKLRKRAQAEREAKDGKRPKQLPWKKSRQGSSQVLNDRVAESLTFKEYLINEARYHKQKEIYTHLDSGYLFELVSWDNPYGVPNGATITVRDLETEEEHVIGEEEFLYKFQLKEE